ncbi:putative baseplate assembly protein [Terriglobus roseus]|uniref:putative baseplate assembly protein n=1 Tax=Terriglobus roseus TaxID=392734 RepID=UPI0012EAC73F|nr:putative baseplate assembly protein [Terriglobus roseus]
MPAINYLAKDYDGFRQGMLDRMSVLMPAWNESHAADVGITLVEAMAYVADRLSYMQDAVNTEAYLDTARSRISLRRHARLVDYRVGEGCNARSWVCVATAKDALLLPAGTNFYVRTAGVPPVLSPDNPSQTALLKALLSNGQPVYASMADALLYQEQNAIDFYTWSDTNCCLPQGAVGATLSGNLTTLQAGSVLILEEVLGAKTGKPDDSNRVHRWAVRLTEVRTSDDEGKPLVDPFNSAPVTEVTWGIADALPFPLCISSTLDAEHGGNTISGVSRAWGNVVPVDQGVWVAAESLGTVPDAPEAPVSSGCTCSGSTDAGVTLVRYRPTLASGPVTFQLPFDPLAAASTFLNPLTDASAAKPQITVMDDNDRLWTPQSDLLASDEEDLVFVLEIEDGGAASLRFGDGQYGAAVDPGQQFVATYRIGNGRDGLVGSDALLHTVTTLPLISVRNPLPAAAAVDAESPEHIRQHAPFAFESQLRCVTEDDYAVAALQDSDITQARGTMRWTGSWYAGFVSVEPASSAPSDLATLTLSRLDPLRMMGTGLAVEDAIIVGLRITLAVCVASNRFQSDVYTAIMRRFLSGSSCDGNVAVLKAENFTFGQTVYASPLIAAAQAVDGVVSVRLVRFERMDEPSSTPRQQGYLTMGRLEIARCDNDPNRRDHGIFSLQMEGGR